jgi:hypothetical protein
LFMMQEGGVILDIVLFVGICFVFGVFDLEIYFWCVVGCYSSTSRKSIWYRRSRPPRKDNSENAGTRPI